MSGLAKTRSQVETFKQFVTAINSHDAAALTALMTSDHVFVGNLIALRAAVSPRGTAAAVYFGDMGVAHSVTRVEWPVRNLLPSEPAQGPRGRRRIAPP